MYLIIWDDAANFMRIHISEHELKKNVNLIKIIYQMIDDITKFKINIIYLNVLTVIFWFSDILRQYYYIIDKNTMDFQSYSAMQKTKI